MTELEFNNTNWQHHDIVRLTNGKQYVVQKKKRKKYILLFSTEYETYFVADYRITECRTHIAKDDYTEILASTDISAEVRIVIAEYEAKKPRLSK